MKHHRSTAHRAGRESISGSEREPVLLKRHRDGQSQRLLLLCCLPTHTNHRPENRHVCCGQKQYVKILLFKSLIAEHVHFFTWPASISNMSVMCIWYIPPVSHIVNLQALAGLQQISLEDIDASRTVIILPVKTCLCISCPYYLLFWLFLHLPHIFYLSPFLHPRQVNEGLRLW